MKEKLNQFLKITGQVFLMFIFSMMYLFSAVVTISLLRICHEIHSGIGVEFLTQLKTTLDNIERRFSHQY